MLFNWLDFFFHANLPVLVCSIITVLKNKCSFKTTMHMVFHQLSEVSVFEWKADERPAIIRTKANALFCECIFFVFFFYQEVK